MNPLKWLNETTRITREGIYFGDQLAPGCIAEGGITITPGGGRGLNRMTVTFLVGEVIADNPEGDR